MRFRLKRWISFNKAIHTPLTDDGWPIRFQTQLGLQICIFSSDIETWTGFQRVQIMMPYNQSGRIALVQCCQEGSKCGALFRRASVLRSFPVGSQSAYITYTDTVTVVVSAMGTSHLRRSSGFYRSVRGNHIVIATAAPAEQAVITVDVLASQLAALLVGGAVNYDKSNLTHGPRGYFLWHHRRHRSATFQ